MNRIHSHLPAVCFTLAAAALTLAGPSRAEIAAPPPDLTLDSAVAAALHDNPQLSALRARRDAMLERPAQVTALPNPMVRYSGMDAASGGTWPDTGEKRYMIEQTFPGAGKRGLRLDVARKEAEAMQHDLEAMTREIVMQVKESYFELRAVRQAMAVTRGDTNLLQHMAGIAESLYTTGQRTQQDVLKARSEAGMLTQRLLELAARETTVSARLNLLLARRPDAPVGEVVSAPAARLDVPAASLLTRAAEHRPEVLAAETQAERYGLEKRLMARESRPDYTLGLEYRDIGGGDNMVMVSAAVELPLWRAKVGAGIREAERLQAASQAQRDAARRQAEFDVQTALANLEAARQQLALFRTDLLPQAEARFNASEAGYQSGKVDFMDLLESQRFLLSLRVMAAMTEGTLGMQWARLEWAVGTDLTEDALPDKTTKESSEHER